MGIYSRVIQPLNTLLSLGSWVWWGISATGLTGALLVAWASTTLPWLGASIVFIATLAVFFAVLLFVVWASREENGKLMEIVPIIGILIGGMIFVGSIAWVVADNRRAARDVSETLARYVLPRHLTEQQITTVAEYLSKTAPQKVNYIVAKNNTEASAFWSDINRAITQGGWSLDKIEYSDDVQQGITTHYQQTMESARQPVDPKQPKPDVIFRDALKAARIQLSGGGGGSGIDTKENVFTIKVGIRRMDDGDLIGKKLMQERARRILDGTEEELF
jgi:hypothetical protein